MSEKMSDAEKLKTRITGLDEVFQGGIPHGSSILLIAPPIIEARLFCLDFLSKGLVNNEAAVMLTTDDAPENLKEKGGEGFSKAEEENRMFWVDTYSINASKDVQDTVNIKRIGGPVALSDMAIALSDIQIAFNKSNFTSFRFVFDSLSTLLMYSSPDTVYYFLQSIIPKMSRAGGVGLFVLSSGMHDPKVEMTIRHLMGGALQLDDNLNLKILNFPTVLPKKDVHLTLQNNEFSVDR
ncbi:MAG: RAD55 family ATPase [Candidatus Woesearchaeota archaeon]